MQIVRMARLRHRLLPVALATAATMFLACGGSAGIVEDPGPKPGAAASRPELRPATADDVLHEVQIRGGRVTLVNVWATWCGPCVEEMPGILKLHNQLALRGMELILVSGDFHGKEDQVVEFLAGRGVDFPSFIKDGDDQAFINGMNTLWTGALPASFLYSADGKQIDFWEGTISYAELKEKLLRILDAA